MGVGRVCRVLKYKPGAGGFLSVSDVVDKSHGVLPAIHGDAALDMWCVDPVGDGEQGVGVNDFKVFHLKPGYGIQRIDDVLPDFFY